MQKNWFIVFNVKVTANSYIIKIWLFLLYLLNCWLVWNQTWFNSTTSEARVSCGKMGLLHWRSRSQQRFKMSVNICPDDIFSVCLMVSAQYLLNWSTIFLLLLLPNLVWWCTNMRWCVMWKNWFFILTVEVTVTGYVIKIWLFLLSLLNCWSVCNQTCYDSANSSAGVSCGKMGLLHSRSRSQWRLKMFINVCLDDIFWITEHFVAKRGMVMQHHKPECLQKNWFTVFNVKVITRACIIKTSLFLSSKLLVRLQPNLVWQHSIISQSVLWENGITAFKVKVTAKVQNVSECLSGWCLLNRRTFCYETWCSITSQMVMRKFCCCCCLQGQDHSQGSYDQNMTLFTILSHLLIPWQPKLVWWYIIICQSVFWKKLDHCSQGQAHSEGSKSVVAKVKFTEKVKNSSECSFGRYLFSCWTFCNQTWYGDASLGAECHARRLVCCLTVQGHTEGSFYQVWLFLPYLLNCWSFCIQIQIGWYIIISWSVLCKN